MDHDLTLLTAYGDELAITVGGFDTPSDAAQALGDFLGERVYVCDTSNIAQSRLNVIRMALQDAVQVERDSHSTVERLTSLLQDAAERVAEGA